jgi:HEAT repeat protein
MLAERLGDSSKIVQIAAAYALREIATRRQTGYDAIAASLRSDDDRTRWGAAMVFNQHFRYLAQHSELLEAMIERLNDPSSQVRRVAAQALPKWYFWLKDDSLKVRVEEAVIEALGRPQHPHVRRALIEGFRNINDDNVRYLYNTWIIAAKKPEDQNRIESSHREHVVRQAARFARVLAEGN